MVDLDTASSYDAVDTAHMRARLEAQHCSTWRRQRQTAVVRRQRLLILLELKLTQSLEPEARSVFRETDTAQDGMIVEVPFRDADEKATKVNG